MWATSHVVRHSGLCPSKKNVSQSNARAGSLKWAGMWYNVKEQEVWAEYKQHLLQYYLKHILMKLAPNMCSNSWPSPVNARLSWSLVWRPLPFLVWQTKPSGVDSFSYFWFLFHCDLSQVFAPVIQMTCACGFPDNPSVHTSLLLFMMFSEPGSTFPLPLTCLILLVLSDSGELERIKLAFWSCRSLSERMCIVFSMVSGTELSSGQLPACLPICLMTWEPTPVFPDYTGIPPFCAILAP